MRSTGWGGLKWGGGVSPSAQTGKRSQSGLLGTPAGAIRALPADLHRRDRCPHASPVSANGGQHYST
jgi:hypothetical protein